MKTNFCFILLDGEVGQYPYKYPYSISCIGGRDVFWNPSFRPKF